MNLVYKFLKEYKYILITITLSVFLVFGVFIFSGKAFIISNDQLTQYNIFYEEWIQLIKDMFHGEGLPFYSWNSFLGSDFYSSQVYYVVGDIFLPLLLLIDDIKVALLVETILCVYIASILMNAYLKEYGIRTLINRNFIAIVYGLSGFATIFVSNYMFLRFYAFLPALFWGFERILNKDKKGLFVLSVTLLFLQSYYLMFPTSIFLLIYGIYTTVRRGMDIQYIIQYACKCILLYIVGLLISAVVIVPGIISIIANPRIGEGIEFALLWDFRVYSASIINLITPPYPMFSNVDNYIFRVGQDGHEFANSFFITIIPLLAAFGFILKKENKVARNTFLCLVIILFFRPLSSIMHGFSNPSLRWTFLILFYLLIIAAEGLEEKVNLKKPIFMYFLVYGIALLILCVNHIVAAEYSAHFLIIFISFLGSLLIYIVYNLNKKASMILCVLQLTLSMFFIIDQYQLQYEIGKDTLTKEYVSYYIDNDADLIYRYNLDESHFSSTSDLNLNQSLYYGYMGVDSYNTSYDASLAPFLQSLGFTWHIFELDNPNIMTMLGVKYYIVYNENELPQNHDFSYAYSLDHLSVYYNDDYHGFGYTCDQVEYIDELEDTSDYLDTVFVDDITYDLDNYQNVEASTLTIYEKTNNGLKAKINSKTDNILFLPIPNNTGWMIEVNQQEVESISVNGGFLGIPIKEGENIVEMNFMSSGFKEGFILSFIGLIIFGILMIRQERVKE